MKATARAGLISVLTLMVVPACFAGTIEDYRARVTSAIASVRSLHVEIELPPSLTDAAVQAKVRPVHELLPRNETVEWNGTKFFVDNSWLDDQLKECERAGAPTATRLTALEHIQQRLQALDQQLGEINTSNSQSFDKAAMRDRLSSILQRPEYQIHPKEESAFERLMRMLARWIGKLFPKANAISPSRANAISRVTQIAVIVIALAAIGYVLWMFAPRFFKRRRAKKSEKQKPRIVLGERLEPDQSAADLLAEAESLARSGDLRGAIRRGYIALLVELADRKLISLAQYKTNRDYLRSVRAVASLYRNMESLTHNFELHWYGLVPAEEHDWLAFRAGYREALSSN
jgi:hypothetical protein